MPRYLSNTPSESVSTTPKTVLAIIGPSTRRHRIYLLKVSGKSVTQADAPLIIELIRTTQATAGTSTSITPAPVDQSESPSLCSAARTYTVEPTVASVIDEFTVSPIGATYTWEIPQGRELFQLVSVTFGVRITTAAALSTTVSVTIGHEE